MQGKLAMRKIRLEPLCSSLCFMILRKHIRLSNVCLNIDKNLSVSTHTEGQGCAQEYPIEASGKIIHFRLLVPLNRAIMPSNNTTICKPKLYDSNHQDRCRNFFLLQSKDPTLEVKHTDDGNYHKV